MIMIGKSIRQIWVKLTFMTFRGDVATYKIYNLTFALNDFDKKPISGEKAIVHAVMKPDIL